jgi:hypothetical protein
MNKLQWEEIDSGIIRTKIHDGYLYKVTSVVTVYIFF